MPRPGSVLDLRTLNRALLQRQWLLSPEPSDTGRLEHALEHLVGLQSQAPEPPFTGLWTRLAGFSTAGADELLQSRRAVRTATLRGTLHLVTSRDAMALRPLLQPVLSRQVRSAFRQSLRDVDIDAVAAAAATLLRQGSPMTFVELARALSPLWPEVPNQVLGAVARAELPLVQVPPRGLWGRSGPAAHLLLDDWVGGSWEPMAARELVTRYLAAFGPATVRDLQAWCGLTGLATQVRDLGTALVSYRDEDGRELLDLPGAPIPGPGTEAPVRFVPAWDNLLLSHADRARVLPRELMPEVFTNNGIVRPTVLVDGFVAATWKVEGGGALVVRPLVPLGASHRAEIADEGRRLQAFLRERPGPRAGDDRSARQQVEVLAFPELR